MIATHVQALLGFQVSAVSLAQDALQSPIPDLVSGSSDPFSAGFVAAINQASASQHPS